MSDENAPDKGVNCTSDLAQLLVCEADTARPWAPFRVSHLDVRFVLDRVADRLPQNPRAVDGLVQVAVDLAYASSRRADDDGQSWPLVCEVCGLCDEVTLTRPPLPGDRCFEHTVTEWAKA